jgi:uncharacterized glyoxalase superfamily protein PhnB
MPPCTVIPELVYEDVGEAIDWLCDRFGFTERWRAGNHRAQLAVGDGAIVFAEPWGPRELGERQWVMVRVDDADSHHEHARRRGVTILRPPTDFPYGERQYNAEDLGGHQWTFSESIADVAPEEWGGTTADLGYSDLR